MGIKIVSKTPAVGPKVIKKVVQKPSAEQAEDLFYKGVVVAQHQSGTTESTTFVEPTPEPAEASDNTTPASAETNATKAVFKQMKAQIVKQNADGSEESKEETFGGEMFEQPPANLSVTLGLTRNLGNYESLRFSVSLSVPCANIPSDIEQSFAFAKEWVDGKVNIINAEVEAMLK